MASCKPRKRDLPSDFVPRETPTWVLRRDNTGKGFLWQGHSLDDVSAQVWIHDGDCWQSPTPGTLDDDIFEVGSDVAMWVRGLAAVDVLSRLHPAGEGQPDDHEWAFRVSAFEDQDGEFAGAREASTRGYVCLDGNRVQFAEPDGTPFLTDSGDVVGTTLATFDSGTEFDGMSGASQWTLTAISPTQAIASADGDAESPPTMIPLQQGYRAAGVAQWLELVEGEALGVAMAAAIELEPFDLEGTLSSHDREAWEELFSQLDSEDGETVRCWFALTSEEREELRGALADDLDDRVTRDALREPATRGARLRERLESGDWSFEASE